MFSALEKVTEPEVCICTLFSPTQVPSPLNTISACEKIPGLSESDPGQNGCGKHASLSAGWSGGLAPLSEGKRPPGIFSAVSLSRSLQVPGGIASEEPGSARQPCSPAAALQPSTDFPGRGFLTGGKPQVALPLWLVPRPQSSLVWGKAVGERVASKNSTDTSHS